MPVLEIPNVWETANQSVKWAHSKNYKLYDDSTENLRLVMKQSKATLIIGIRLTDLFPLGTIDIATIVPGGYDFCVVGPHRGGRVRRQDLHKITLLCSPQEVTDPKQRQIQQLNYGMFINIMAEMVKKYSPRILV